MARTIPELLVPAGGAAQLRAAVANGADAVYLSGRSFNARISADNFSDEELREAIRFAHTYGVDVHIAMNILLRDNEMDPAADFACRMYEAGADALIVQDPGLIACLRGRCPDLPLHMSTQGSVYDAAGAKAVQALGMSRVITARELSLDEIRRICRAVDIEVEVFVHGAICIGYSGQCHLSGTIGERSGNRGECAQPCRLPYELIGSGGKTAARGYLLSPHDMSLLDHLDELADAGVASLKIEGRLKSPEYVAMTTAVYRRHLDRLRDGGTPVSRSEFAADTAGMRQVFSRGVFTDAYLQGRSGGELMAAETPKHTGIRIGKLIRTDRKRGHATVRLSAPLQNGDGVEIRDAGRSCGNVITYIRSKNGKLLRRAEPGMAVTIGDLDRERLNGLREGAPVFRITDAQLQKQLRQTYEKIPSRVPVDLRLVAVTGRPAVLTASAEQGGARRVVSAQSDAPLEWAESRPLQEERARQSLEKTGDTPYTVRNLDLVIEGDPFLPASALNALRRRALEALTEARTAERGRVEDGTQSGPGESRPQSESGGPDQNMQRHESGSPGRSGPGESRPQSGSGGAGKTGAAGNGAEKAAPHRLPAPSAGRYRAEARMQGSVSGNGKAIALYFYRTDDSEERIRELAGALKERFTASETVPVEFAVPYDLLLRERENSKSSETAAVGRTGFPCEEELQPSETAAFLKSEGIPVYAVIPAVTRTTDPDALEAVFTALEKLFAEGMIAGVYAANLSHVHFLWEKKLPFITDVSMNVLNSRSAQAVRSLGASGAVLSVEPDAMRAGFSFSAESGTQVAGNSLSPNPAVSEPGAILSSNQDAAENCSVLSPNQDAPETAGLSNGPDEDNDSDFLLEAHIYGRTPAMYMAHCPVGGTGTEQQQSRRPDCTAEKKRYYCRQDRWSLKDRFRASFPIVPDFRDCSAVLYSHTLTDRSDRVVEMSAKGISRFRICVFSENSKEILDIIEKASHFL